MKSITFLRRLKEWFFDLPRFFYVQRVRGFSVPSRPHFDSEASTRWFTEQLAKSDFYVEYGAGGSTFLAAQLNRRFVSIDSDPFFLKAVAKKIESAGLQLSADQKLVYANIGLTKAWGFPLYLYRPTPHRLAQFARYSDFPNNSNITSNECVLVLVDGRFRVACAAKAFKALQSRANWRIVVDDYAERPEYHVLEEVGKIEKKVGRMVIFTGLVSQAGERLPDLIRQYEQDPR